MNILLHHMRNKHLLGLFLTVLALSVLTHQECDPLYPRLFWNPNSTEIVPHKIDHIFMFNTNTSCPYSFVHVYLPEQNYSFRCTQKRLQTFNDDSSLQFFTYVQTCAALIEKQKDIRQFTYQIFGSKYIESRSAVGSDKFQVEMPTVSDYIFRVISDWGPIIDRPYKPLNDTLDYLLSKRQAEKKKGQTNEWRINGVLLNGDYAYELETTHCQRYVMFLNEISRITRFWPLMANLGNHQSTLPKSLYLFDESFIIGNVSTKGGNYQRTQTYRFVNKTTFLMFDPYLQIYKIGTRSQYATMRNTIFEAARRARQEYPEQFFIMASHYPVMCSQVDPHCRDSIATMPDLYSYLSTQINGKGLVDMYIGSHMHQYERIWPFVNNQFVNESSPYYRGRMVNFVEAVAGVNYWQVEAEYEQEYFSVFATHNITGMGILTISGSSHSEEQPLQADYKHITTPKTYEVVDQFKLTNKFPPSKVATPKIHLAEE